MWKTKVSLISMCMLLIASMLLPTLAVEASSVSVTQVRSQVQSAESEANKLWPYFSLSNTNQVTYSTAFNTQYNRAVSSINTAQNSINRLNNSSDKTALQQRLNSANNVRFHAAHLIDAIRQGDRLQEELNRFNQAINKGQISEVNDLYDQFTSQIRRVEMHVGRVYGSNNRQIVGSKYIRPAKIAQERTIYEVSQYRLLNDIHTILLNGNHSVAASELAKLSRLNNRASEIKAAGGYQNLPASINSQLQSIEQTTRSNYENVKNGEPIDGISQSNAVIGTITASVLNVRTQPNASSSTLGQLRQHDSVEIVSIEGSWAEFYYNNSTAYIHTNFINFGEQTDVGMVTATSLNVRSKPTAQSNQTGRLTIGTYVQIYQMVGDWSLIRVGDLLGFVHSSYVKKGIPNEAAALVGRTIAVDPGHGGKDPGAVAFGVREKDVVLSVGLLLEQRLKTAGANVVMTRNNDTFIELPDRSRIANDAGAEIFVSIHANAAGASSAHGTETYWNANHSSAESKELAEKIQKRLIAALNTRDRGAKEGNFSVIRHTRMPSVLVELGFVTNQNEAQRLTQASFQRDAAEAIYLGILDYYRDR
ncbi:N-acetylmuramoyl-L-alanine amidase [Bacillus sp. FJAT-45037]|uniref:N-acetylmuramoyl-L-alanine amidase n=1 Tax=Bacillus sp. FJAT-45037 TaxID=2011007 RepID=UPI0018E20DBA|nr:N-acetylmuramoyl-L-alanine amidase [Bacillus sp. FJAT-45037]